MAYDSLASNDAVTKVIEQLAARGVTAELVPTGAAALARIKELIPAGASVMNGASRTLEQIGYTAYLASGEHSWNDLHAAVTAENDEQKRAELRKQSVLSDYYLGSVHALSETGEFLIASNTGSQLPHVVFTSPNLILVVGTQKIVPSLEEGMKRLEEYVIPLEDENMQQKYGMGTQLSKIVIFKKEAAMMGRKVTMLLVDEKLGF